MTETNDEPELVECPKCKRKLPVSAFYPGRFWECREDQKKRYRDWYANHKQQREASIQARQERIANGEPSSIRYKPKAEQ